MSRTLRVAYFSPLTPMRTSVSHYSDELLPQLCRRAHVDVYTDDRIAAAQEIGRIYPLYGYHDFAQARRYDQLVFQIANSPEHLPIYDLFLRYGGVAVLHDLDLWRIIDAKTVAHGDRWGYVWEVRRNEGFGPFLRTAGDALLRGQWPGPDWARRQHPAMNRMLARRATGLIVHSRAAREHLRPRYPNVQVHQVPLGVRRPPATDPAEARRLLHLPPSAFICLSTGRLGPETRVHVALQAFARLLQRCPECLYVAIGEPVTGYPLPELAQTLGIGEQVRLPGYVDLPTLYRYLAACDVGISLQSPGLSAVSDSLLRIMSVGRPVVIANGGVHDELPDDCTLKVDPGAGEVAEVAAALWALCSHPPMRQWYGRHAARYVQGNHSVVAAARLYVDLLEKLGTMQSAVELLQPQQAAS